METPAQLGIGENPDGSLQGIGESVGAWNPNADPSNVNFEDLRHASARVVRGPERDPAGTELEAMSGADLLGELRTAINGFNGVGSERETMSRLSRLNPFRDENHSAADVRRAAERLDEVQGEMSTRLEAILRDKQRSGAPAFNDDAVETALAAHKLFGTFTVARLRKESLESQADKSNSRGILGRVSGFLTRRVVDIDQRVADKDISKMRGRLTKLGYFGITALPLGVAGVAAAPLLGLGAGAAAVGAGAFAAARVGRGLFSAKIQNAADSITRAEHDQIERVGQQMGETGTGITSAFVEGGEAKVRQADRRMLMAAGSTAAFGALGYFGGNIVGEIGRDLKDNGILHYMGDGVDKATDFGDDFIAGDGHDSGGSGGSHGADSAGSGGAEAVPSDPSGPSGPGSDNGGSGNIIDTVNGAVNDAADAASAAYQDIKQHGIFHYLNEGADTAQQLGDDALNGVDTDHLPHGSDVHQGGHGADIPHHGPSGSEQHTAQQMSEMHQRQGADFLVDANTGEKIKLGTLNVKPGGGFITTFQEQYGLSSQQANDLYYKVEPHLRGMDGTYAGPGDVRISAPGDLKLSADARQAVHNELVNMGVAEDKQIRVGLADAKAVSPEIGVDQARAVDTQPQGAAGADTANTGGLAAENPTVVSAEEVRSQLDDYLNPDRLQEEESWGYVENIISGVPNGAISTEQMSSINDMVTARISILEGLQDKLDVLQARGGNPAQLAEYEGRLNLAVDRLNNVSTILEEAVQKSAELDSGE